MSANSKRVPAPVLANSEASSKVQPAQGYVCVGNRGRKQGLGVFLALPHSGLPFVLGRKETRMNISLISLNTDINILDNFLY